jgi:hypothetical protein
MPCLHHFKRNSFTASLLIALALGLGGCETGGQSGGLAGAGIGALAGNAIGGNSEATLIGAAIGGGLGYIIGNEDDKKKAQEMSRDSEQRGYTHTEVADLGGTRWTLVSLAPRDYYPPYASKIIEFRPYGRIITTTTAPDGDVSVTDERYRVVGRTLIVNRPGYIVNAEYGIEGDEMIIDAEEFRAVLKRLRP